MQVFFGTVESIDDTSMITRYKVRVIGVHNPLSSVQPIDDLPWAVPIASNSAGMSGIGQSQTGYLRGSTVVIVFTDSDLQIPLILGSITGFAGQPNYKSSNIFSALTSQVSLIPPATPANTTITLPDGTVQDAIYVADIPAGSTVNIPAYIGALTKPDIDNIKTALSNRRQGITTLGTGKYQLSNMDLQNLGYIDAAGWAGLAAGWTGLNGITSSDSFIQKSNLQDDAEEILLKSNFSTLVNLGIITAKTPKEKQAGLLLACQCVSPKEIFDFVEFGTDTTNIIGDTCFSLYQFGYALIAGKTTSEQPTPYNLTRTASDKSEDYSDPNKSKFEVSQNQPILPNQGFRDPSGTYPLSDFINEPETPRLATGISLESTIVGKKEGMSVSNVQIANGSVVWKQTVPYNAVYPYNNVYQSQSGHVLEFDDTPSAERVHLAHKSGTFYEVDVQGNSVERSVGVRTIIVDKDELVYIKGSGHTVIDGDISLHVKQALQIQIDGDANIHVKGDMNHQVDGNYNIMAKNINLVGLVAVNQDAPILGLNEGMASGTVKPIQSYSPNIILPSTPTRNDIQVAEIEDTNITLTTTQTKVNTMSNDSKQPTNTVTGIKQTSKISTVTYDTQLSVNYRIQNVCVGKQGRVFPFSGQHNLTDVQLASNLKDLCLNVIEPIREKFLGDGFTPTSIIRPAGNPYSVPNKISQHELGMAIDMVFTKYQGINRNQRFITAATWIRDNILFDQLLLEYRGSSVWLHISYNASNNRRNVLTLLDDKTYGQGLILLA